MKSYVNSLMQKSEYRRGNIMTSLFWMCGLVEILLTVIVMNNINNWLGLSGFILAVVILIFYAGIFIYFAKTDPDRLQSEGYNLDSAILRLEQNTKVKIIEGEGIFLNPKNNVEKK